MLINFTEILFYMEYVHSCPQCSFQLLITSVLFHCLFDYNYCLYFIKMHYILFILCDSMYISVCINVYSEPFYCYRPLPCHSCQLSVTATIQLFSINDTF